MGRPRAARAVGLGVGRCTEPGKRGAQVVAELRTEILPQAREMLSKAEREAGTTVPTSFKAVSHPRGGPAPERKGAAARPLWAEQGGAQALETVVTEAERLLQQVNADTGEASESLTGFKATADGIEQQLIVFRQLLDLGDPGQMKGRPGAGRLK